MTIERRAQVIVGVLILTVLAMGLTLFWSSRELDAGMKRIDTTSRAVHSAFMLRVLMDDYLHHGTARRLREWERERDSLGQTLNGMYFEFIDRKLLSELRDSFRSVSVLAPQIIRLTSGEDLPNGSQNAATKDMLTKLMLLSLEELVNTANDLSRVTQSHTLQRRYFVQQIIIVVGILGIAAIFINVYLTRKSVVQPLKILSQEVERIGEGDFASIPEIPSDDEVGNLSRAFNAMVERLEIREIALKQARDEIAVGLEERSAALERANEYNDLLHTIQRAQSEFIANLSECFPNLLHDLLTLTRSEFGFIDELLYTEDGQPYLKTQAMTDLSWDDESRTVYKKLVDDQALQFDNIHGLRGTVILTGETVISNDPGTAPGQSGLPEGHPPLHSFLGLPLYCGGEIVGMVGLANRLGKYDKELADSLQPVLAVGANLIEAYRNEIRRREAEQQLEQKLDALRQAENLAHLGYFERNWQNGTGYWSDGFFKILGRKQASIPSHDEFMTYVHEDDRNRFADCIRDSLRSREPMNIEFRIIQESGSVVHVHQIAETAYDDEGQPVLTRGTLQNITDRKLAEEALRQSEEKFRLIFENSPLGVVHSDANGIVTACNDSFIRIVGTPRNNMIGLNAARDLNDEKLIAALKQALAGGKGHYEGAYASIFTGKTIDIKADIAPMFGRDGAVIGAIGIYEDIGPRLRMERELRESEERLRMAKAAAKLGVYDYDILSGSISWDERVRELWGVDPDIQITYQVFESGLYPDDREAVGIAVEKALDPQGNGKYEAEYRVVSRNKGNLLWVAATGTVFFDHGRAIRMVGTVEDVTERKQAQADLRESEKRYRRLHETMRDAFVQVDLSGRIIDFNTAYQEMVGYSREELTKLGYRDLTPAKWHEIEAKIVSDEIMVYGKSGVYEKEYRHKSGKVLPVELRTFLLEDDSGWPSGMWAIVSDITERKRAEDELRKAHDQLEMRVEERTSELELANRALQQEMVERQRAEEEVETERRRFYDILEVLPLYVMLVTPDYHIKFCNRFFRERFGEPAGIRCFDHLFGHSEPCERCETFVVLETMAPHQWEWTGPDDNIYDVHGFPFTDTDGSILIMEVGIDITERKQFEDELKQTLSDLTRSNADLEQFAYVASHDLQEPLRNVAGCLQLLEKKYKSKLGSEADLYIRYAVEGAAHMRALIQDLLAYSRIGTRGKPPAPTDCEQIFTQVLKNLGSSISQAGAVITHDPLPTIWGDDTQLLQVFQNLVGNAVKFRRDEPPKIHVSTTKNPDEWVFSVKDNGMGIDAQYVDRIFAIFQRLNKRSEHEGTGIGLAIVKKVVERHHGRIWVDSEPGVGTTFYFTIPDKGKEKS